jgi:hypothetical protein
MHQKERDFLRKLNELELILKGFVDDFFVKGIKHSKGDQMRFYKFLEEYRQLETRYHEYKGENTRDRVEKSRQFYKSFFNDNPFGPNRKD